MRKLFLSFLALLIIGSSFTNVSAAFIVPASTASEKPDPATVKAAMEAFNNLSKAERKEKKR